MNDHPTHDDALRQALRESINAPHHTADTPADTSADTQALQARVLAQWQQRHPATELSLAGAGGRRVGWRAASPGRLGLVGVALVSALALAWVNRADPVLEELSQPDVLSQIGLGEF